MDILEAIKTRKSIRSFKPDPVPKEILKEILDDACRAPSGMNTQPWEFTVLAGDVLENIQRANVEKLNSGAVPNPEHLVIGWPPDIFKLMDIQREDKEKRAQWMERGFRFFDAPAAIILMTDRSLTEAGPLLDMGAVMQNICLSALNYGLGTCIEDQGGMYPDVLRKFADIHESKRIIICIAIGYPNWDFPANKLVSTRVPADSNTTWCGFD
jgi:nitroreductase